VRPEPAAPNAVVVGADGFIGQRLTSALSAMHVQVETYARGRRFSRGANLARPVRGAGVIFYLASSITPALGESHPEWAAADHTRFAALLRGLARFDSPPTVVLTSSGGTVYDSSAPPPYTEDSPTRATSLYAAAKIALEAELAERAGSVPGVILRLSNVYGPGQRAGKGQGVLAAWLRSAAQRGMVQMIGDPEHTRDYVYVDDVTRCLCLLYEAIRRGRGIGDREPLILNVGSGRGTSLAELIEIVRAVVGRDLLIARLPARRHDRPHVWLDCGKADRLLGWRSRTGLADGVLAMWHELATGADAGSRAQAVRPLVPAAAGNLRPDASGPAPGPESGPSPLSQLTPGSIVPGHSIGARFI